MKIIGHRGAAGLATENTLESIQKALELKVDGVEVDVRVTKDGAPVLSHDPDLNRLAGQNLTIQDNNYADLKTAFPALATLDEAIKLVNNKGPLMIEVKPGVDTKPIIEVLRKNAGQKYLIASFSQKTLVELHKALPGTPTVVIERYLSIRARLRARQLGTKILSMNQKFIWFGFVWGISKNYELYAYNLDSVAKAKRWQRYGLSGVITNYPDRFN